MIDVVRYLVAVPPWAVLLMVFALPASEASTLLGLAVPGEVAVLVGGVLADQGRVPLPAVMAAAVVGAVVGDNVGYALGARLGPALRSRASDRGRRRLDRGSAFLRRWGGPAILLGRWTAFLRAVIPSAAGISGFPYARFAVLNVVGGTIWGIAVPAIGFLAGVAYRQAERSLALGGAVGLLVLIGALLLARLRGRTRKTS
ncbi:MAG TPA: VTT domain-containing protein [Geodermatophilus sp.]|nr:VTT domain-containing protein [Geodermatophilus sp.]